LTALCVAFPSLGHRLRRQAVSAEPGIGAPNQQRTDRGLHRQMQRRSTSIHFWSPPMQRLRDAAPCRLCRANTHPVFSLGVAVRAQRNASRASSRRAARMGARELTRFDAQVRIALLDSRLSRIAHSGHKLPKTARPRSDVLVIRWSRVRAPPAPPYGIS